MIGTLLNERYRVDALLGRGGMGTVYRAFDSMLERQVAVKFVTGYEMETEGRARLLQEAKSIAQLNHPNIVTVHDAGEVDKAPYIVMELIEGESLHARPPKDLSELVRIASQICAALEHAHERGIVHRDLKPENVLIDSDGNAKLMDFGIARSMASRMTQEGQIEGTVFYMAPEIALGQVFDDRADLYSLGVMLYELVTGAPPFSGGDLLAIISQHLHATVVPPSIKNEQVPPRLEGLILRLMEKDPNDRPPSASAVIAELKHPDLLDLQAETDRQLAVISRIARGRFVGREHELKQARSIWMRASAGDGQTLLVSGEPGIGKSRFTKELTTQVEVTGGRVLVGESYAEGGAPYSPIAQILRKGIRWATQNGSDVLDLVLADLLSLTPELRPHFPDLPSNPPLDPESEQRRLFESVVVLCTSLSVTNPLLIVLEDAHWSDSGTLALLHHLARRSRKLPVMLLATYREVELDEARPLNNLLVELNRERLGTRIKLSRFSKEQTHDLLYAIFEEEITPEFLEGIHRETEGNPFYIEEVCKALVEDGRLYYQDGRWHRPENMDELEIPQSVRVAIRTRIARLPETHQWVLSLAAIFGREFDFEVLAEASDLDEDDLIEALESAEAAQLIEESGQADEDKFRFVHALIPAALVDGVRKLRRRKLHRRAASAIETLRPENYEALAHHYSEAGDDKRALQAYTRAGERAAEAYANQEAEQHFRSALDLVGDKRQEADLLTQLGLMLDRLGRHEEAIEVWAHGIELYESLGEPDEVAYLYARSARAAWEAGDPKRGLEIARQGMAAVEDAPDGTGLADLYHETARALFFNGERGEGSEVISKAQAMAERVGALRVQIEAMISHGSFSELPAGESVAILLEAAELAHSNSMPDQEARARNNSTVALGWGLGQLERARQEAITATELAHSTGPAQELFYGANAVWYGMWRGDLQESDQQLGSLLQRADELVDLGATRRMIEGYRAIAMRFMGHLEDAMRTLQALFAEASEVNDSNVTWATSIYNAELALETDKQLDSADQALRRALELSYGLSAWPSSLRARILARKGEITEARSQLEQASQDEGSPLDRLMVILAEADLSIAEGDHQRASSHFERAVEITEQCGMRWYRAHTMMQWATALAIQDEESQQAKARELLEVAAHEFGEIGVPIYQQQAEQLLAEINT